jgi:putative ABC transport system substrate-binding protein
VTREWRAALSAALLVLLAGFASAVPRVEAQTAVRSARVGYLSEAPLPSVNFEAFRRGLRDLGWVEGQNLVIEHPAADGRLDRLPALAAGLVASRVDVIVATALAVEAAKAATKAIPIVFVTGADPVATRLVGSLARPGANVTGVTTLATELEGKRLGLLKEAMPHLKRVAILINADRPTPDPIFAAAERSARSLGLQLQTVEVREGTDLENAVTTITRGGAEAFAVAGAGASVFFKSQTRLAQLALKTRIPAAAPWRQFAEAGGLMSYGANTEELFRRAAGQVDKILKGARPGDLPVEQASKFEMVVNVKTAKALGLTLPQPFLLRADELIQ